MKPDILIGDIEAVIVRTDRGIIALMEQQIYSLLPSQLKLNILREAVILIGIPQGNPSVLVHAASVLGIDIQAVTVRVETSSAGVEISQSTLVNISAVGEWIAGETNL